jgi:hypothetical protein
VALHVARPGDRALSDDPFDGFLPPNVNPPEGDGAVFFTVKLKPGLAEGTQVRNRARIVFDANAPIDTPEWLDTTDDTRPTSQVQALASTQSSTSFNVNWAGTDAGSGVAGYTVYFSENGGPFEVWADNQTATSANFNGQPNTTYGFYSIAAYKRATPLGEPPRCAASWRAVRSLTPSTTRPSS